VSSSLKGGPKKRIPFKKRNAHYKKSGSICSRKIFDPNCKWNKYFQIPQIIEYAILNSEIPELKPKEKCRLQVKLKIVPEIIKY